MSAPRPFRLFLIPLLVLVALAPRFALAQEAPPPEVTLPPGAEVVATGLTNPRGMIWGADGTMFVALAGSGGPNAPTETYETSPFEAALRGGLTGAVASIDASGCPVLVAGGLPSTVSPMGDALGAEGLAILGDQLYAAVDGGGAMHGNEGTPSGVYRILADGSSVLVADLSTWVRENPVANADLTHDFDAAGYAIEADPSGTFLWVVDPNSSQILSVTPDGVVTRIADLSEGHPVITKMALDPEGGVYVGTLTAVPFPDGAAKVIHVAPDGTAMDVWTGLTTAVDVAVGPDGTLYALEMSTNNLDEEPFLNFNTGRIVRQTGPDQLEVVIDNLMLPIELTVGPDGAWYVSLPAVGAGDGSGMILRFAMDGGTPVAAGEAPTMPTCTPLAETLFTPGSATPEAPPSTGGTPEMTQAPAPEGMATPEETVAPEETTIVATPSEMVPVGTPAETGQEAQVTIEGFAFQPQTLEISAGTTVTWTNNDAVPHTATADDGSFDTGNIESGASASFTFDTPGTYTYYCAIHPNMTGTIVVT